MIFQNGLKDPKALSNVGRMCLVIGLLCQMFFHPATEVGRDLVHGLCGLLIGLSLGLLVGSAFMIRRQRRASGC